MPWGKKIERGESYRRRTLSGGGRCAIFLFWRERNYGIKRYS